jgi:integrase
MNDTLYRFMIKRYGNGKKPDEPVFGHISQDYLSHGFRKACQKAGVKDFRFHDLRHTFASHLVMSGVNIFQVSKWLGHSSVTITEKYYAHFAPDCKREEIEKLNKLNEWATGSPNFHPTFENLGGNKKMDDSKLSVNSVINT